MLSLARPVASVAQKPDSARARLLAGCWSITVGPFKATTKTGIDSGMTNLPARVRLDTVPGVGLFGEPRDWLLRAIPDTHASRYGDGLFFPTGRDKVRLMWSNGFVALSIDATVKGDEMRGTATAGTDYGGEKQAAITLQRIICPPAA